MNSGLTISNFLAPHIDSYLPSFKWEHKRVLDNKRFYLNSPFQGYTPFRHPKGGSGYHYTRDYAKPPTLVHTKRTRHRALVQRTHLRAPCTKVVRVNAEAPGTRADRWAALSSSTDLTLYGALAH